MSTRYCWGLITALVAVGCARYQAKPLTGAAVDQALTMPPAAQIRERADALHNPLLHSVSMDLRNGLTPDSAAIIAVVVNPSLRAQRVRRSLASAQVLQAGLLPNPTLDFALDPVTGGNTAGAVTAYNVGVNWEITALLSHDAKLAASQAASRSVQLDVAWQEWQFAQAAKQAVYDLVAFKAQARQAAAVDRQLADNTALIRRAVDSHDRTLLDLSAAETASQKAHADYLAAQRDYRHQILALNQSLGLEPLTIIRVADSVSLPSRLDLPPEDELAAGIERQRLDLLALKQGYESQEQTLRAAVLAQFPRVLLGFHQASDNTNVHSTGFGVTIDLPIFDRNQGAIAIQEATRQQLFDEYAGRLFEARSALALALTDAGSLTAQIAAAEKAIPVLEELVKAYRLASEQHNADPLNYYTAQSDLAQKRIDLLKLKQQLLQNKIAIELATGRYLPEPATAPATTRPATTEPTQ